MKSGSYKVRVIYVLSNFTSSVKFYQIRQPCHTDVTAEMVNCRGAVRSMFFVNRDDFINLFIYLFSAPGTGDSPKTSADTTTTASTPASSAKEDLGNANYNQSVRDIGLVAVIVLFCFYEEKY